MHQHIPPSSRVIPPLLLSVINVSRRLRTEKMRELWGCWDGKRKVNECMYETERSQSQKYHNYPPSAVPLLPILTFELIVHFRFWFWGADNSHHTHISIIIVTFFSLFFSTFLSFCLSFFWGTNPVTFLCVYNLCSVLCRRPVTLVTNVPAICWENESHHPKRRS